jgi:hypothetical protein
MQKLAVIYGILMIILISLALVLLPTQSQASNIQVPSDTPTPSFNPVVREHFLDLLAIEGDCLFPCWQGIALGESNIDEAIEISRQVFNENARRISAPRDVQSYDFVYDFSPGQGVIADGVVGVLQLYSEEDTFSALYIFYKGYDSSTSTEVLPNGYLIENVVSAYGLPDEVWLLGTPNHRITLVYNEHKLLIEYGHIMVEGEMGIHAICPDNFGSFSLRANFPSDLDFSFLYSDGTQLDAITDLSPEELIDIIIDRDTPCVDTPGSIWSFDDTSGDNPAP